MRCNVTAHVQLVGGKIKQTPGTRKTTAACCPSGEGLACLYGWYKLLKCITASFSYIYHMEYYYPENMTRLEAFTRRSTMFIALLRRDQYAVFTGADTVAGLIKVIKLIIWALELSLPEQEWNRYKKQFTDCLYQLQDVFETSEAEQANYERVLDTLSELLEEYRDYIQEAL